MNPAKISGEGTPGTLDRGGTIRTLIVSLLGAMTLTAGFMLIRSRRETALELRKQVPAGEHAVRSVSIDRLRELGL